MFYDSHVHSVFSFDSDMLVEEACKVADSNGLAGLVFTEHFDIDFPDEDYSHPDWEEYFRTLLAAQTRFPTIQVLKGVEFGHQHGKAMNQVTTLLHQYPFDYVINSVHVLEKKDLYESYYADYSKREVYVKYLEEVAHSISADNYDVIGHIGYLQRYSPYKDFGLSYLDYTDLLDVILKSLVTKGKGLDVNTSGYRAVMGRIIGCPIPGYDVINRYKDLGGETLVLGSDAHNCASIGDGFAQTAAALKELGIKYAAYFKDRIPNYYPI